MQVIEIVLALVVLLALFVIVASIKEILGTIVGLVIVFVLPLVGLGVGIWFWTSGHDNIGAIFSLVSVGYFVSGAPLDIVEHLKEKGWNMGIFDE